MKSRLSLAHYKAMVTFVLILVAPTMVKATPIYDDFGSFPDATWGGSGIPNDAVAASRQFFDGTTTITVAMSVTQRFSNPAPTNNGAGVYFAQTGSSFEGAGPTEGALWNFNYYVKIEDSVDSTIGISDFDVKLFYDFDPSFNTAIVDLGVIDITAGVNIFDPTATLVEDSQNLMFDFLAGTPPLSYVTAPTFGPFDPNAIGEYGFGIQVSKSGWGVETVAIDVQTVPVPAAVWLFGSGLLGLVGIARRKKAA